MRNVTAYTKVNAEDLAICVQWLKKNGVVIPSRSAVIAHAIAVAAESISRTGFKLVGEPEDVLRSVGFNFDASNLPVPKAEAPTLDASMEADKLKQMLGE